MPRLSEREERRWAKRRRKYYKKHDGNCAVCGIGNKERFRMEPDGPMYVATVDLHHKSYKKGYASAPNRYLVPLCRLHHSDLHTKYNEKLRKYPKLTLKAHSNRYIKQARAQHKARSKRNYGGWKG